MSFITKLVGFFTATSITVSYFAIGTGLLDTVYSLVGQTGIYFESGYNVVDEESGTVARKSFRGYLCGWSTFSIVFFFVILNPSGFEKVLEKYTSFLVNMMAGPLVYLWYFSAFEYSSSSVRDNIYFTANSLFGVLLVYDLIRAFTD